MMVLSDFDDTAADQNVAQLLLDRFLPGKAEEYRERLREGQITLKEYQESLFSLIGKSRNTLKRHAHEAGTLRNGFVELAHYCQANNIELAIATIGLDFYVEAVLEKYGLQNVRYFAVETNFTNEGIGFTYRYTRPGCERWGNCKCRVLDLYREQGHRVIYAGDGVADMCPASNADFVFAHKKLLGFCQENGISHRELHDFHDVIAELKQNAISEIS